jgi:hypothetical protein
MITLKWLTIMHRFNPPENLLKGGYGVMGTTVGGIFLGNQMNVPTSLEHGPLLSEALPYESLDTIPRNSFAYPFAYGDAQSAALKLIAGEKRNKVLIL